MWYPNLRTKFPKVDVKRQTTLKNRRQTKQGETTLNHKICKWPHRRHSEKKTFHLLLPVNNSWNKPFTEWIFFRNTLVQSSKVFDLQPMRKATISRAMRTGGTPIIFSSLSRLIGSWSEVVFLLGLELCKHQKLTCFIEGRSYISTYNR